MENRDDIITVIGHKAPDSDSLCSAIACAGLLNILGYKAKAACASRINKEGKYILSCLGLQEPEIIENVKDKKLVLVDHSSYSLGADGLRQAKILEVIDHHLDGDILKDQNIKATIEKTGACATLSYEKYKQHNIVPDKDNAILLLSGILSDTSFMRRNVTAKDYRAYEELLELVKIKDVESYYKQMEDERLSYEGMSADEIFMNDYKEYETGHYTYGLASLSARNKEEAAKLLELMKEEIKRQYASRQKDYLFLKIAQYEPSCSYMLGEGKNSQEILTGSLGLEKKTDHLFKEGQLNRKNEIVPAISRYLSDNREEI